MMRLSTAVGKLMVKPVLGTTQCLSSKVLIDESLLTFCSLVMLSPDDEYSDVIEQQVLTMTLKNNYATSTIQISSLIEV